MTRLDLDALEARVQQILLSKEDAITLIAHARRLERLDVQFGKVEAWIALNTDFTRGQHHAEKGAEGLIAALERMKARIPPSS